jgi:Fe-S cluster assembly iron-binding protein IscA
MALVVTDRAAQLLLETLENIDHQPEQLLRLVSEDERLTIALDHQREDDIVIEYLGSPVLLVESAIGEELDGVTMDFFDGPDGGRLTLVTP